MGRKKAPDETRATILRAAFRSFAERGYEATTVNQLLEEHGLSKGAFYHHFASKEEVLDAVIEALTTRALAEITAEMERAPTALAKLECFVSASRRWRTNNVPAVRMMLGLVARPDAVALRDKLRTRSVDTTAPLLADVLAQGAEEGVFGVSDPAQTARQILQLAQPVGQDQADAIRRGATTEIVHRADAYLTHVERMVGIEDGTLSRPSTRLVARLLKALKEDR